MGLNFPVDLDDWQRWQADHHRLQRMRARLTGGARDVPALGVAVRGSSPTVLVAIDSSSPSGIASLHGLLSRIPELAVVSSVHGSSEVRELLGGEESGARVAEIDVLPASLAVFVGAGHYLAAGAAAWKLASARGRPMTVVQHGLLTPFNPPLPPRAHVLAFSDEDGSFWASGRDDIGWTVVGSQLFWDAAGAAVEPAASGVPQYLGQLHGAELPRRGMTRAASRFWRETGATYRPHPSEVDRLSRVQHALWERQGMRIDRNRRPLADVGGPVVAAFSTGILEAAAAGLPSWSFYPDPPRWLAEFWERYGIRRWETDDDPTPAPPYPDVEPALAIADAVLALAEGAS
ncbi:MAG: RNA-binding protein [Actinobacteria bacterium]|nr:RNA-binding protein [Actinomycetota bacterium]